MSNEFNGYYVRRCTGEDNLWTVGFDHPLAGWEPESDHNTERAAKRRAWELNGIESRYAYMRSEPELWTVGDCSRGFWDPVSDHGSAAEAADEVIELNA
jgi:hypothetical protein